MDAGVRRSTPAECIRRTEAALSMSGGATGMLVPRAPAKRSSLVLASLGLPLPLSLSRRAPPHAAAPSNDPRGGGFGPADWLSVC